MADPPTPGTWQDAEAAVRRDERREWPRVSATRLAETAVKLANGSEVRLVDLSRGGARLETDRRMLPNATIAVKLVTGGESFVITGLVVRSRVIRLSQGGLGYDVAIAFNETVHRLTALPALAEPAESPLTPAQPPEADAPAEQTPSEDWADSMIQVTANVPHSPEELIHLFEESAW